MLERCPLFRFLRNVGPRPCLVGALLCVLASSVLVSAGRAQEEGTAHDGAWDESEVLGVLGENWRTIRTPHVRVFLAPHLTVTRRELEGVEEELHRLSGILGLDDANLQRLRLHPLSYYYTDDSLLLGRFFPFRADGIAFPDLGIIVAQRIPFGHELAHVLVHEAVFPAPPANERWLQEGLASWLAGDGERHPRVILDFGDQILDAGKLDVGMLWGLQRFDAAPGSDLEKYAVAARFVDFLVHERGIQAVLALYRLLCDEAVEVSRRPMLVARAQVEAEWGAPWPELMERFDAWRRRNPVRSIAPAIPPERAPETFLRSDRLRAGLWRDRDGGVTIRVRGTSPVLGSIVWGEKVRRSSVLSSPGVGAGRFTLHFDVTGIYLRDEGAGRLLAATEELSGDPAADLIFRVAPEVMQPLGEIEGATLFEAPRFETPYID